MTEKDKETSGNESIETIDSEKDAEKESAGNKENDTSGVKEANESDANTGGEGVEKTVEENGGDNIENGVIPELHDDVFKAPFRGYNVSDLDEVADAVGQMNTEAGIRIEEIHRENETLKKKLDALEEKFQMKKQEFQKYKQRKITETEELKDTATKSFIRDALPLRDDLERALNEENEETDIRSGVELIKRNFDELLQKEGVNLIQPELGDELDPEKHKVMTRVESDAPDGTVVECFRTGYEFDDLIIRPARVTVSASE